MSAAHIVVMILTWVAVLSGMPPWVVVPLFAAWAWLLWWMRRVRRRGA